MSRDYTISGATQIVWQVGNHLSRSEAAVNYAKKRAFFFKAHVNQIQKRYENSLNKVS